MDQIHTVQITRGLTSATVRCHTCEYAFVAVNDCHGGVSIDNGRWLHRGAEGAVHVFDDAPVRPLRKSA